MSIQIVDAANAASRQELRERIKSLIVAMANVRDLPDAADATGITPEMRFQLEVKALYTALTGYGMTKGELVEVVGGEQPAEVKPN